MPLHEHRPTAWWKRYPESESRYPQEPGRKDVLDPRLSVGTRVRLCGKPNKARAILKVEWHRYRYRYVYVVEASGGSVPYWFADQLMPENETRPFVELAQQRAEESIWHKARRLLARVKC